MRRIRIPYLIHGFAALHAVVTFLCSLGGFQDSLILTLLTMALTVILCVRRNLTVELTAIAIILVNILGYVLGTLGARFFGLFVEGDTAVRILSTFATTEILGWSLYLSARRSHPSAGPAEERKPRWHDSLGWIAAAVVAVFLFRVVIDAALSTPLYAGTGLSEVLGKLLSNSLSIVLMVCATVLFMQAIRKRPRSRYRRSAEVIGFVVAMAAVAAVLTGYGIPFGIDKSFSFKSFLQIFLVAVIAEATLFAIIYLVTYALVMRDELAIAQEKTHDAEFRYMAFMQQVNPHFLFNSLNILDSLVLDGEREDASRYIHQLAGMYRYMLQHEGEWLVRVSEELVFADMYYSLLKVRFPEGFEVETDVAEGDRSRFIVPCALQLLLENATKHNAISAENPLVVRITTGDGFITVENRRIPKKSPASSTGLGLKYIRQQYHDAGAEVDISATPETYRVRLPLL